MDLTGKKFHRWTVIRRAEDRAKYPGRPRWLCKCECGTEKVIGSQSIREGVSQSCGCWNIEVHRQVCIARNTTHGRSGKDNWTYRAWTSMRQRCLNTKYPKYRHWGGRGIKICSRWDDYTLFVDDMGECPPGLSLERKNSDGHYEPENCIWATQKQQQNNRRNNRRIEFNGENLTLMQWSARLGVHRETIAKRIGRLGWSIERALTEPPQRKASHVLG